jgi:hypothetical protein
MPFSQPINIKPNGLNQLSPLPWTVLNRFIYISYCRQLAAFYGEAHMLESIALILIILWVLGLVSSYTMGGFIHILLVLAVIVIVLRVIQGQRVL